MTQFSFRFVPMRATCLAVAVLLSGAAQAAATNKAEYNAARSQADGTYKSETDGCKPMTGNAKDICKLEAKGHMTVAKAEAELLRQAENVIATAPITASARVSTVSAEGDADLAWVASAQSLDDTSLVAVAPGPGPILTLANPTKETISVTVGGETTPQTIGVEPATSVSLSVAAGARLELTGARGLVAAVSYSGPGALASFPVSVPAASSTAVRVYRGN